MSTPYYQDEHVTLYRGDCLEVMEWLEADVLVTDPPYGIGAALSSGDKKADRFYGRQRPTHDRTVTWDKTLEVRNAALALWGDRPAAVFGTARRLDDPAAFREVPLIWDKGESVGMGDTTFPWRPSYELIYVSGGGVGRSAHYGDPPSHVEKHRRAGHRPPNTEAGEPHV